MAHSAFYSFQRYEGVDDPTKPVLAGFQLNLDQINVAGKVTQAFQQELAKLYPFANAAYRWIWNGEALEEILSVKLPERPRMVATSADYKSHFSALIEYGILRAEMIMCKHFESFRNLRFYSKYFCVPKSDGSGRSIFSGGRLSRCFHRPPSVNLPHLPHVLKTAAKMIRGKLFMINFDLRHYFHQIEVGGIRHLFGVRCNKKNYTWRVLPMGWSYSPRIAQCYAWAAVLSDSTHRAAAGLDEAASELKDSEHPPSFVVLRHNNVDKGVLFVWYDNVIALVNDADTHEALSKHLYALTSRFGMVWNTKEDRHHRTVTPDKLQTAKISNDFGVAIGIQFAYQTNANRNRTASAESTLRWRLNPKTVEKTKHLLETLNASTDGSLSCRAIQGMIGTIIWRLYVSCTPMIEAHEIIQLSSEIGKQAAQKGWDSKFKLSELHRAALKTYLTSVIANLWIGAPSEPSSFRYLASDAAATGRGGWVHFANDGTIVSWDVTEPWTEEEKSNYRIYYFELLAAVRAIESVTASNVSIVIAVDNTAAAAALRNMYSSTTAGRELIHRTNIALKSLGNSLVVAGVPGPDNVADILTRPNAVKRRREDESSSEGSWEIPHFDETRRELTFQALLQVQRGTERRTSSIEKVTGSHFENLEGTGPMRQEEETVEDHIAEEIEDFMYDTRI